MNFYLNWHRNYERSNLKACFLFYCVLTVPCKKKPHDFAHFHNKMGGFKLYKPCHSREHLTPKTGRSEASKKVLVVHFPQGAAKLYNVKVLVFIQCRELLFYRSPFYVLNCPNSQCYLTT